MAPECAQGAAGDHGQGYRHSGTIASAHRRTVRQVAARVSRPVDAVDAIAGEWSAASSELGAILGHSVLRSFAL